MIAEGATIGPYRVLSQMASGGMAVVYRAEQPALNRLVAIKELRTELLADQAQVLRFEREALCIAAMTHHNIVHIYDFITRGSSLLMVMEYVEGVDLSTLMGRVDRIPPDIAAIIALEAARALAHAHRRGIVHRDFKPANLMVTKQGEVKLMDFGIARDDSFNGLTAPGTALGTPAYMSPEQVLGRQVDFRSDLFSFGIVLYQMLTGHRPFLEETSQQVMRRIVREPYPRPRALYPDIPRALQRIVGRCLEKRAERRYQNTETLRRDLEAFVTRKVRMNHNGRLVIYLRHEGLIGDSEADNCLHSADADMVGTVLAESGELDLRAALWRPLLTTHAAALALMLLWTALVGWTQLGTHPGRLRVNARPWAEVHIDGQYHDTTPFVAPVPLRPGRHELELRNRHFAPVARTIEVAADQVVQVDVNLADRPSSAAVLAKRRSRSRVRRAINRYEAGDFGTACNELELQLNAPGLGVPDQIDIVRYLGFCAVAADDRHAALDYFRRWLELVPEARLDPVRASPKIRAAFRKAKEELRSATHGTVPN